MTAGLVLAGGKSRRFGSPKAFAVLDGKPFWQHAADALHGGGCRPVLISARPEHLGGFGSRFEPVTDVPEFAGDGPLAGIYSAMMACPSERIAVLPCDMPFAGPEEVRRLLELSDPAAPVTAVRLGEQPIPLLSVWDGRLSGRIRRALSAGERGVMPFLARVGAAWLDTRELNEDPDVFRNVNTPL